MSLTIIPIGLAEANAYIERHHRHHKRVRGCKFCLAVVVEGDATGIDRMAGIAIVGRPVARYLDNGLTAEVVRLCTDGTRNACSALYGAAWRAARSMGYQRLITYTLPEEGGGSLRGAGWRLVGARGGGNWNTPARPRVDTHQQLQGQKHLWEAIA